MKSLLINDKPSKAANHIRWFPYFAQKLRSVEELQLGNGMSGTVVETNQWNAICCVVLAGHFFRTKRQTIELVMFDRKSLISRHTYLGVNNKFDLASIHCVTRKERAKTVNPNTNVKIA